MNAESTHPKMAVEIFKAFEALSLLEDQRARLANIEMFIEHLIQISLSDGEDAIVELALRTLGNICINGINQALTNCRYCSPNNL